MPRLNRAESQARTRSLIIESATMLFLRDGFRATSLEQIAEHAGFTRGAAYSNFANKTEIGLAVVDALYEAELQRAHEAVLAVAAQGEAAWAPALAEWARASIGNPQFARLELEVMAFAGGDQQFLAALGARYAKSRERTQQILTLAYAAAGHELPEDLEMLALAMVSVGLGFGLQRAADQTLPFSSFSQIVTRLVGEPPSP